MENSMFLQPWLGTYLPWLYVDSAWWTYIGLVGNGLFTSRFLIQWIKSERQHRLVIPPIFWYLSFWGSCISLIYALHVDKLPIILSFAFLPVIYGRNLRLLKHTSQSAPPSNT